MSRHRIAALIVAVVAAAIIPVSVSAYGDAKGPPCSDYTPSDGFGQGVDSTTGTVVIRNGVSKPACDKIDYVLHVLDATGQTELATAAGVGMDFNGIPTVAFEATIATGIDIVCVYLTSERSGKVVDRAPDTGCDTISGNPPAKKGWG